MYYIVEKVTANTVSCRMCVA